MTVILGSETLKGALEMGEAIDVLERAFEHEAAGRTATTPRTHLSLENGGSIRLLVAADYESGYLATKAYNNTPAIGTRYIVSLYRLQDGELLALLDANVITDLRTGAASGVIARKVPVMGPVTIGVIGSGNQARAQLRSLAAAYAVQSVAVYSPSKLNCEAYAREMSLELGFPITVADSVKSAVVGRTVVATASRSRSEKPILYGEWLHGCRLLCAVGNTRKQFSEADVRCFHDASLVVVDSPNAWQETGELVQAAAAGAVPESRRATLAQIVSGAVAVPADGMIVFKSVGTALEDLALAALYYERLSSRPELFDTAELGTLRKADVAQPGGGGNLSAPVQFEVNKPAPTTETMKRDYVVLNDVSQVFPARDGGPEVKALGPLHFSLKEGEFFSVVGPSGCGKSTLLEVIAGLATPTTGRVTIGGEPIIAEVPAEVGVVFQEDASFPWLTVWKNILFGLKRQNVPKKIALERAEWALNLTGLTGFRDAFPAQLSGGMRQRVCIARTLVMEPKLILLDEPFGALDQQTRLLMGDEVLNLWRATGATIMLITHSIDEAAMLSDRVGVMSARPGRFLEIIETGWDRGRDSSIAETEKFGNLTTHLWSLLRRESIDAQQLGARA